MKFIIGIGNPGKKYEKTRHNVGFEVVDALARRLKLDGAWKDSLRLRATAVKAESAVLLKPKTFVNNTGDSILAILREYAEKSPKPQDILIVCDDVNLDFGKLRLRAAGSAGGHHGLESVTETLNSEDFPRLRFGVRNAAMPRELTGFVLDPFDSEEKKRVGVLEERAVLVCESWLNEGFEAAVKRLSQLQG